MATNAPAADQSAAITSAAPIIAGPEINDETQTPAQMMTALRQAQEGSSQAQPDQQLASQSQNSAAPDGQTTAQQSAADGSQQQPVADATTQTSTVPTEVDLLKKKNEALEKIIAANPQMRAQYLNQQFGLPLPQQPVQQQANQQSIPQQQQPGQQQPVISQQPAAQPTLDQLVANLFKDETYDPYNPMHALRLQQFSLQPAMAYINQLQQQDVQHQQQTAQQKQESNRQAMVDKSLDTFEQHLPGFKTLAQQPPTNDETRIFLSYAGNAVGEFLRTNYPPETWTIPEVQIAAVNAAAEKLKPMAAKLGIALNDPKATNQPSPATKALAREMYVESSASVPSSNVSKFDTAYSGGKGSPAAMMGALREMSKTAGAR